MNSGINSYNYQDYRAFLKDWFWTTKEHNPKLSFRFISRQLGLKAPNHFHLVISRKRHLSLKLYEKLIRFITVNKREQQYLKLLFSWELEKNRESKERLQEQCDLLRKHSVDIEIAQEKMPLIGDTLAWYIQMGASCFEGKTLENVTQLIVAACKYPLAKPQVDAALQKLISMKMLEIKDKRCRFEFANITTKWDHESPEIKYHHMHSLQLAMQSLPWPIQQRFFSSVTIPCDNETYQFMIKEVRSLCIKILEEANQRARSTDRISKVATLHFSLFPYFEFKENPL